MSKARVTSVPGYKKTGLLKKCGDVIKSWKERLFALTLSGAELHYYEDEATFQKNQITPNVSAILGTIELTAAGTHLRIVTDTTFEICTPKRIYQLVAPGMQSVLAAPFAGSHNAVLTCWHLTDVDSLSSWIASLSLSGCKIKVPTMQGYVDKKGDWNSGYKKRFFRTERVSDKDVLSYYESTGDKANGSIELKGCTATEIGALTFGVKPANGSRLYELQAFSPLLRKKWIAAIEGIASGSLQVEQMMSTADAFKALNAQTEDGDQIFKIPAALAAALAESATATAAAGSGASKPPAIAITSSHTAAAAAPAATTKTIQRAHTTGLTSQRDRDKMQVQQQHVSPKDVSPKSGDVKQSSAQQKTPPNSGTPAPKKHAKSWEETDHGQQAMVASAAEKEAAAIVAAQQKKSATAKAAAAAAAAAAAEDEDEYGDSKKAAAAATAVVRKQATKREHVLWLYDVSSDKQKVYPKLAQKLIDTCQDMELEICHDLNKAYATIASIPFAYWRVIVDSNFATMFCTQLESKMRSMRFVASVTVYGSTEQLMYVSWAANSNNVSGGISTTDQQLIAFCKGRPRELAQQTVFNTQLNALTKATAEASITQLVEICEKFIPSKKHETRKTGHKKTPTVTLSASLVSAANASHSAAFATLEPAEYRAARFVQTWQPRVYASTEALRSDPPLQLLFSLISPNAESELVQRCVTGLVLHSVAVGHPTKMLVKLLPYFVPGPIAPLVTGKAALASGAAAAAAEAASLCPTGYSGTMCPRSVNGLYLLRAFAEDLWLHHDINIGLADCDLRVLSCFREFIYLTKQVWQQRDAKCWNCGADKNARLYRGLEVPPEQLGSYKPGQALLFPTFLSASRNIQTALTGGPTALYVIEPLGPEQQKTNDCGYTNIDMTDNIGYSNASLEILFVPLCTFEVTAVTKERENGKTCFKVYIKETTASQHLHSLINTMEKKMHAANAK